MLVWTMWKASQQRAACEVAANDEWYPLDFVQAGLRTELRRLFDLWAEVIAVGMVVGVWAADATLHMSEGEMLRVASVKRVEPGCISASGAIWHPGDGQQLVQGPVRAHVTARVRVVGGLDERWHVTDGPDL